MDNRGYREVGNRIETSDVCLIIEKENRRCLQILRILENALTTDINKRPSYESVLGVYFIDILKFTTHLGLRRNLSPEDISLMNQYSSDYSRDRAKRWPYVHQVQNFEFGHRFVPSLTTHKKRFVSRLANLLIFFRNRENKRVSVTSSSLSKEILRWSTQNDIALDLVSDKHQVFYFLDLMQQINALRDPLDQIAQTAEFPVSGQFLFELVSAHILANCSEGQPLDFIKNDVFLAGSGCEIEHRLLSASARFYKKSVINVFHGGSYGVQDKPNFSVGEQLLCTHLIAFGQQQFLSESFQPTKLIYGRFPTVAPPSTRKMIKKPTSQDRLMYVPTSLRGKTKRFGPYEDMPDDVYVDVWKWMRKMFGSRLIIKLHPKSVVNPPVEPPFCLGAFETALGDADTFIFDYHSTAFNIASGTDKPIVFLDYGLQNFTPNGLRAIKSRCIYFNMKTRPPATLSDIFKKGSRRTATWSYVGDFVSSANSPTINVATQQTIQALLARNR